MKRTLVLFMAILLLVMCGCSAPVDETLPATVPTDAPTNPPTNPPTVPPTDAPTDPPTEPPTEAPTDPPTEPPTEAPTEPENKDVTLVYTIQLPDDREEDYALSIHQNGHEIMGATTIAAGTSSIQVELTGNGVQYFELYIDGSYYKTEKVEFTVNG